LHFYRFLSGQPDQMGHERPRCVLRSCRGKKAAGNSALGQRSGDVVRVVPYLPNDPIR
jgi:hypothetical protein